MQNYQSNRAQVQQWGVRWWAGVRYVRTNRNIIAAPIPRRRGRSSHASQLATVPGQGAAATVDVVYSMGEARLTCTSVRYITVADVDDLRSRRPR